MSAIVKPAGDLYQQLCALPEHHSGEIIDGILYSQPRPAGPHALASSLLGAELSEVRHGNGGAIGWWIIDEPEVHFVRDTEVCVPDIAGWRRERMPRIPRGHRFEVVPDWVCEILSPGTAKNDRVVKMPVYARYGVAHLWLVDPLERILEAYALQDGHWWVTGLFKENDTAQVAPFEELALNLANLWPELEDE